MGDQSGLPASGIDTLEITSRVYRSYFIKVDPLTARITPEPSMSMSPTGLGLIVPSLVVTPCRWVYGH